MKFKVGDVLRLSDSYLNSQPEGIEQAKKHRYTVTQVMINEDKLYYTYPLSDGRSGIGTVILSTVSDYLQLVESRRIPVSEVDYLDCFKHNFKDGI